MSALIRVRALLATLAMVGTCSAFAAEVAPQPPATGAGKVSLMTVVPQVTPISDYRGENWSNSVCAFCSGGFGAQRQELYEKGIALDFSVTNVVQGIVSGGRDDDEWANTNITDQQISLDSGRLGLWPGGLIVFHGRSKLGSNVLSDAGTISPVNHNALTPNSTKPDQWFLEEYYIFQAFSETWSGVAGRVLFSGVGDLNRFAGNEKTQLGLSEQRRHMLHKQTIEFAV